MRSSYICCLSYCYNYFSPRHCSFFSEKKLLKMKRIWTTWNITSLGIPCLPQQAYLNALLHNHTWLRAGIVSAGLFSGRHTFKLGLWNCRNPNLFYLNIFSNFFCKLRNVESTVQNILKVRLATNIFSTVLVCFPKSQSVTEYKITGFFINLRNV